MEVREQCNKAGENFCAVSVLKYPVGVQRISESENMLILDKFLVSGLKALTLEKL
jgi:hypothetical protein